MTISRVRNFVVTVINLICILFVIVTFLWSDYSWVIDDIILFKDNAVYYSRLSWMCTQSSDNNKILLTCTFQSLYFTAYLYGQGMRELFVKIRQSRSDLHELVAYVTKGVWGHNGVSGVQGQSRVRRSTKPYSWSWQNFIIRLLEPSTWTVDDCLIWWWNWNSETVKETRTMQR